MNSQLERNHLPHKEYLAGLYVPNNKYIRIIDRKRQRLSRHHACTCRDAGRGCCLCSVLVHADKGLMEDTTDKQVVFPVNTGEVRGIRMQNPE
jgi:hypothetical protein